MVVSKNESVTVELFHLLWVSGDVDASTDLKKLEVALGLGYTDLISLELVLINFLGRMDGSFYGEFF